MTMAIPLLIICAEMTCGTFYFCAVPNVPSGMRRSEAWERVKRLAYYGCR
jgi:hypothetical protein